MNRFLILLCIFFTHWGQAQPPNYSIGLESLASVRFSSLIPQKVNDIKVSAFHIGADFRQPIGEENFYLGGRFAIVSFNKKKEQREKNPSSYGPLTNYDKDENEHKVLTLYPEITLRKYLAEQGFCPYAQMNASYASSSLFLGVKPHIFIFELDVSVGYHLPFYKNAMERDPFFPRGFQFLLGISVPFEMLGVDI